MTPVARDAYAGLLRRGGAWLLDALLAGMLVGGARWLLRSGAAEAEPVAWPPAWLLAALGALVVVACWHLLGGTPGKRLMDCRVVDLRTGRAPGWGVALLRLAGIAVAVAPAGLGLLWMLWDPRRQGWHDKLAGTAVMKDDEATKPLAQLMEEIR